MTTSHSAMLAPPRLAFVLAAGLGTRLRPLTERTPKPLLPLWGKPILQHILETLRNWGVEHVLVNVHHAPAPLLDFLASNPVPGLRLTPLIESEILGTGGALRAAAPFLADGPESPFWLINGDIAFRGVKPEPFLRALATAPQAIAACWTLPNAGPRTLRIERAAPHRILTYSAPRGTGSATFAGLHLIRPAILSHIRSSGFDTIIDAYRRARSSRPVLSVSLPDAFWADLGTPSQYLQAHHDLSIALAPHPGASFQIPLAAAFNDAERDALTPIFPQLSSLSAADRPFLPITALPARASQRQFYRLPAATTPAPAPATILVKYSPARPDNLLYAPLTRHLAAHGIPVPRLLLDRPDLHLLALQDLGPTSLQDIAADLSLKSAPTAVHTSLYAPILPLLRRFHALPPPPPSELPAPLSPPYDRDLALWEIGYFDQHYLCNRLHLSPSDRAAIRRRLRTRIPALLDSPPGTIHRDLQSSNILYPTPSTPNQLFFIDYQALRPGPIAYDLASLLLDPYVSLPWPAIRSLLSSYAGFLPDPADRRALLDAFPAAATLRLAQAIGAYARLSTLPGMHHFIRHLAPALRRLRHFFPF